MPNHRANQPQPGRHGGARPGAGAPRGPRLSTLVWNALIVDLVVREVGKDAHAVMQRAKVLRLAARILMFNGDMDLAGRAFLEAARLSRPKRCKEAAAGPRPFAPGNDEPPDFSTGPAWRPAPEAVLSTTRKIKPRRRAKTPEDAASIAAFFNQALRREEPSDPRVGPGRHPGFQEDVRRPPAATPTPPAPRRTGSP